MNQRGRTRAASIAMALWVGTWGTQLASAQPPAFKRVELQRHDLTIRDREAVVARGEFPAGAVVPKHTHAGEEIGYVLEGELVVELDGRPALKLKAGDTFFIPAGQVHAARNTSRATAIVLSTYVVEKGKPLASPAK